MGLSKKHLSENQTTVCFDVAQLGDTLKSEFPEVECAYLLGSARNGAVRPGSDLDVAFLLTSSADRSSFMTRVYDVFHRLMPSVRVDLGILNDAEPVYRFEALKGRMLFHRDAETYVRFFSITCREYESAMVSYRRQLFHRLDGRHGR